MRAGTDVLRLCDLNDCSRTAIESKWNRSCNHRKSSIHCVSWFTAEYDGRSSTRSIQSSNYIAAPELEAMTGQKGEHV